jgi:hypothetical protein
MPQTAVIGGIAFHHLIRTFESMFSKSDDVNGRKVGFLTRWAKTRLD